MRLWLDDIRPAPEGYVWCKSVHEAKIYCCQHTSPDRIICIEKIDLDHDSGNYNFMGGDYIELLKWFEKLQQEGWTIPMRFHIHSQNPVGVQNMRAIIERNGWTEVK